MHLGRSSSPLFWFHEIDSRFLDSYLFAAMISSPERFSLPNCLLVSQSFSCKPIETQKAVVCPSRRTIIGHLSTRRRSQTNSTTIAPNRTSSSNKMNCSTNPKTIFGSGQLRLCSRCLCSTVFVFWFFGSYESAGALSSIKAAGRAAKKKSRLSTSWMKTTTQYEKRAMSWLNRPATKSAGNAPVVVLDESHLKSSN